MKKLLAFLLAMTLLLSLCACGKNSEDTNKDQNTTASTVTTTTVGDDTTTTTTAADADTDVEDTATEDSTTTDSVATTESTEDVESTEDAESTTTDSVEEVTTTTTATATQATTSIINQTTVATTNKTESNKTSANKTSANKTESNKTSANKTSANKTEGNKTSANKTTTTKTEADKSTTGTTKTTSTTRSRPNFIVTAPTQSTTVKTTKTTVTTKPSDGRPVIKILSIGHSFSVDAMRTYMWELFEAAGYNATIGYLYYPSASLEQQYHYVKDNSRSYEVYAKNNSGTWINQNNACATDALWDEDWDIVTFQPDPDYGKGTMTYKCEWGCNKNVNDYDHFDSLVNLVRNKLRSDDNPYGPNTKVQFYYHLTWAFATDCKLWCFTYSNYDQMTMYKDFIAATKKYITPNSRIKGVIPCITSIQNARTSFMGDTFNEPGNYNPNADGYHLNDKGDLVAAMTWVAFFTGKSAMDIKLGCKYSALEYEAICEAVDNAIKTPWSVTNSTYTEG